MSEILKRQERFMYLLGMFIIEAYKRGYSLVGGELKRPDEMQALYIKSGKSKTSHSCHQDSVAVDISAFKNGMYLKASEDYRELGELWESLDMDCVWGGRFGDNPDTKESEGWDGNHFQLGGKESVKYYKEVGK